MLNGVFNKGEGVMFAIRAKKFMTQELLNEGFSEGHIWVKSEDDGGCGLLYPEEERSVWKTHKEAEKYLGRSRSHEIVDIGDEGESVTGDAEELKRLRELLPDNLSPSKDYNFSSSPSSRVEWLLGRLESMKEEVERLEEGMDRLLQVMAAEKQKRYDVKEPDFRDGKGNLFLVRCPSCRKENYGPNVSSGP
jgi:hypothetical protein